MSKLPRQKQGTGLKAYQQRPWTPFQIRESVPASHNEPQGLLYENSRYVVIWRPMMTAGPAMVHLSIRRKDHRALHDWRDLQRVKNAIVGPECEAIEIYPKESRLVDTANQYHLWVFSDPQFTLGLGFRQRLVSDGPYSNGAVQRPFEHEPPDLASAQQIEEMAQHQGLRP